MLPRTRLMVHLSQHHHFNLPANRRTVVQCFDINAFGDGTVLGCDFVGTVEKVGSGVSRVVVGDVISGLIWGGLLQTDQH